MNTRLIRGVLTLMFSILIMGGLFGFVYYLDNAPTHIENVDCFDRFGNLIQGLNCDDEVFDNELLEEFKDFFIFLIFPMLLLVLFFTMGIIDITISLNREKAKQ